MIISIIVAMDEKRGIGVNNRLPWHLSSDLKRFKSLTMGHHLIIGRKTFETIGKPLPGRINIVLSRNPDYEPPGCLVACSIDEALTIPKQKKESEVFIIGGSELYADTIAIADRIYLTVVHADVPADIFFPDFDETEWLVDQSSYHPADDKNQYPFTTKLLIRKNKN